MPPKYTHGSYYFVKLTGTGKIYFKKETGNVGRMSPVVQILCSMHEPLGSIPSVTKTHKHRGSLHLCPEIRWDQEDPSRAAAPRSRRNPAPREAASSSCGDVMGAGEKNIGEG